VIGKQISIFDCLIGLVYIGLGGRTGKHIAKSFGIINEILLTVLDAETAIMLDMFRMPSVQPISEFRKSRRTLFSSYSTGNSFTLFFFCKLFRPLDF
jgi:hypothetical protein